MRSILQRWLAPIYRFNFYNRHRWVAQQAALIPPGARVLDAGAGTGRYRHLFTHCQYVAQDFAQLPGAEYTPLDYVCDITAIPVPAQSFDVIVCTEVFEHIPEPIRALHEFCRILKPGGKLLLTAPFHSRLHQEPYHFYSGFSCHWYRRFLPEAGFVLVSLEENGGFFQHLAQEGINYSVLLRPRASFRLGIGKFLVLTGIWLFTWPVLRVAMPLLGGWLDKQGLSNDDTAGYHVVALRK